MEVTRIRTSKAMPVSMQMPRSMSLPAVFVRRSGAALVARWMPEGAQVDESGMPFCHNVTGKTLDDIKRQVRAAGCQARVVLDDCSEYLN